ncbi:hypothetical protein ABVK25_012333 [Lepraria finkii]|uniref:Uncharacterized protein n=1 Tax=Lepraria finkii TaxID=1340010 RepID=A0ABR4AIB8_9LECA
MPDSSYGDPRLSLLRFREGSEAGLKAAEGVVEELKTKTLRNREQTDSVFYAKPASLYAIASGCLELYDDSFSWLRRFVRDPKTVKTIFDNGAINKDEGIALLSGIPQSLVEMTIVNIRERINKGSRILPDFLETAVISLREPSFYSPDREAGKLKRALGISHDDLYDLMWTGTLYTLIHTEKVGLIYKHEVLGFNSPNGRLSLDTYSRRHMEPPLPPSFRFLDDMARPRDQLWKEVQPKAHPAAASLDPPWPRGLAILYLIRPYRVAIKSARNYMPFIASRAAMIIMIEQKLALVKPPADEDTKNAIGEMVASYCLALGI